MQKGPWLANGIAFKGIDNIKEKQPVKHTSNSLPFLFSPLQAIKTESHTTLSL